MGADHVTCFARVDFHSDERVFGITDEDRLLHVYIIGKTGTGKSTLLETWRVKIWSVDTVSLSSIRTAIPWRAIAAGVPASGHQDIIYRLADVNQNATIL